MLKERKNTQKGFTIIEVLIVLAIAGLIMLIVFLAVPALNRNSRNTQRRNDVSAFLGAIQEYTNNNNSIPPTSAANITDLTNEGFYTSSSDILFTNCTSSACAAYNPTPNTVRIFINAKCPTTTPVDSDVAVTYAARSAAIVYAVETSTAAGANQCQQS